MAAFAQGRESQPQKNAGLDPSPFVADDLGLTINLPKGSSVAAQRVQNQVVISISDDPTTPKWTMQVRSLRATAAKSSPLEQIDELLRDMKTRHLTFDVISNAAFSGAGSSGHICFVKMTTDPSQPFISGWLVLSTGPNTFMVFTLQTLPEHMSVVRPLLEASFETITLRSAEAVATQRQDRLIAGQRFLASLTPETLKAMVGQSQWHRIHRPGNAAEAQEIGYSLVEVKESKKGAINESRAEKDYTADERETGLMIRVQARLVIDAQRKDFYDSIGLYWMAWDQSSELWSIIGTRRQGDAEKSESETGIREEQSAATPRPVIRVIKRTDSTEPVPYEWEVPPNYLSQALGWLVGRLLPRENNQTSELAFFYFVSSNLTPKVYQRIDKWTTSASGGQWTLTTQLTSDSEPFSAIYAADGHLIRRVHNDGTITEPIDLPHLQKIWSARGLQVGRPSP